MQFLTKQANIFYISAAEIARNELERIITEIKGLITDNGNTYSFIFIETPPFRWEQEASRQMNLLHSQFEGRHIIHDLILPAEVFREMQLRNTENVSRERGR